MTTPYPDDPGIDPNKTEESPQPDDDNNEEDEGIENEDDPNEITGE